VIRRTRGSVLAVTVVGGLALGYTVSRIGFGDFGEVNAMFTFQDLRMFLAFVGAVVLIAAAFLVIRPRRLPGRIHAGVVPGAVLFGAGWAISGGCPAIPIIQLAAGYLPAAITIAGIAAGVWFARWFSANVAPIDNGSCGL
jgi:uncharacterized protein